MQDLCVLGFVYIDFTCTNIHACVKDSRGYFLLDVASWTDTLQGPENNCFVILKIL